MSGPPSPRRTAGRVSSKACLWRKFKLKFLRRFFWLEMSSDDNHWRAHMTPMARNICSCAVFATTSFTFGLPTYFVSHYCYGRALYAVFYRRVFFFLIEQSCLTVVCQMTCQRSHICWCASCWHGFVLLVQFVLVHLKIQFCLASSETGVAFLQEDYCTHQFAWVFLFSWDRCLRLSFSLSTLFVIWHSDTTWFKYIDAHAKSPLTIPCVLYAAME